MIPTLTIAIATLGALLLTLLGLRLRAAQVEASLTRHRAKDAGLADLLNYAAVVDDGVIVGKNGAFLAAWLYQGDDQDSSTEEGREAVSFRMNQALAGLGAGWMIHVDAVRRPAPGYPDRSRSTFPDPVCAAIDEERRRLFERLGTMYEGYFVLTVTYFPPLLVQRKFVDLMFNDDAPIPDHKARTRDLIDAFQRDCAGIESRLSAALTLQRLRGEPVMQEDGTAVTQDALLRWLQYCITGLRHPVLLPRNPMYLDALLGGQELYGGVVPKIGRQFISVVAIEGFPLESAPGMLTALGELPCE
jgi:type IV secretion system protein VirB4